MPFWSAFGVCTAQFAAKTPIGIAEIITASAAATPAAFLKSLFIFSLLLFSLYTAPFIRPQKGLCINIIITILLSALPCVNKQCAYQNSQKNAQILCTIRLRIYCPGNAIMYAKICHSDTFMHDNRLCMIIARSDETGRLFPAFRMTFYFIAPQLS